MHAYPSVVFPPPPPTSNTLSSQERSALVRTSKKLYKLLGDVPRVPDDDMPPIASRPTTPAGLELVRTVTGSPVVLETKSIWQKRKQSHLPPPLKLSNPSTDTLHSSASVTTPYHRLPSARSSVLSVAPSIVSNAPSTASGSSTSDAPGPSEIAQRRTKLERLRRKLGDEVPSTAVFPTTPPLTAVPHTPRASTSKKPYRARTRSVARPADDARSVTFSISSDESVHTVSLTTHVHSPRSHQTKHAYHAGALPPVPSIPAHLRGDEDAGLVRPRQKMAAGSMIGGSEFKAARRAKREGRSQNGMAEPGELIEMVGFMW